MDREPARSFQDLVVWQKSHQMTLRVYKLARDLGYLKGDVKWNDVEEVSRLLGAYTRTLLTPAS